MTPTAPYLPLPNLSLSPSQAERQTNPRPTRPRRTSPPRKELYHPPIPPAPSQESFSLAAAARRLGCVLEPTAHLIGPLPGLCSGTDG
jgi:hypothetical protein